MQRVALAVARPRLTPSAFGNLADDVANQAVFEYWELLKQGERIDNPEAMVTTIAKRRAIDAQRKWEVRRHSALAPADPDYDPMVIAPDIVSRAIEDLPPTMTIINWLEGSVLGSGGDETDVKLARRVWLEGVTPDEAAAEVSLAEKTARNRLAAVRRRLEDLVERGEASIW
jgi:DNA-directed RNA polymerase specialized sigma24 family protein